MLKKSTQNLPTPSCHAQLWTKFTLAVKEHKKVLKHVPGAVEMLENATKVMNLCA